MLCASGQRKLVNLTVMVVPGLLPDGPMLVHLFQDQAEEAWAASRPDVQDIFLENGATAPPDEALPGAPADDAPKITERELEVLRLLSLGLGTDQIAVDLGISSHTVLNHIRNFRRTLHAPTRLDAVVTAIRRGLI